MNVNQNNKIWIYDTTLRDGSQREGLSLSSEDKLRIAHKLDQMGIPFIEGGWPGANPKDVHFFQQLQENPLKQSQIVAFCSTRRPQIKAVDDPLIKAILAANTHWVTIFGKSWDLHVTESLKTTLEENLNMIQDTITYLISQNKQVIYDAEHWFDGYKHNPEYALKTLQTAIKSGSEWVVLCDTNGGTLPHEISKIVQDVKQAIGNTCQIGIHTHNDSETAVANALAAVLAGANMVQGTINGYGERCGNANLCALIPNLQLKLGFDCLEKTELLQLTNTSRLISEIVNLAPDEHAAYVGKSAFAHKGGIHVSAVEKNPLTYEHITPESVGNERRIVISDQSGLSNVLAKARSFGIDLDKHDQRSRSILEHLKDLENQGYQFEAAEASFDLLMRAALGERKQLFELKKLQINCDILSDNTTAIATIKITVNNTDIWDAAEGNGPVSALDAALRKALQKFYPKITDFYLTDYKVRILDGNSGTSAKTRVLIESSNGQQRWTTVGVSGNIIDASYQAVADSIEYGLMIMEN